MITQFIMDGIEYNVHVMSLKRQFEVKEASQMLTMQSGDIRRDILGTYYNYTITLREKSGDVEALDALWEAISQPVEYHECVFPYNQTTITQRMYVKSGTQEIRRMYDNGTHWRDLTISFLAKAPRVLP